MKTFFIKLVSTFCFVGYLPVAPGTYASLVAVVIYFLGRAAGIPVVWVFLAVAAAGFLVSGSAERVFQKKDASCIVIDEVAGMLLSLLFLPGDLPVIVLAFFLFRVMDIRKPYPCHRLQQAHGSIGIMSDDLVAGLYVNCVIQIGLRLAALRIS